MQTICDLQPGPWGVPTEGLCILHSNDPQKDKAAFDEALTVHRGERGDNFAFFVFPGKVDYFSGTIFDQKAIFSGATFNQGADFSGTTFGEWADFNSTIFNQGVTFNGATFSQGATFIYARFSEKVTFRGTTFSQWADFSEATFSQEANFSGATFSQGVDFSGAKFNEKVSFTGAKFNEKATFRSTTFSQWANFIGAIFSQEANFIGAIFSQGAAFSNAVFSEKVSFAGAEFNKESTFQGAIFSQRVDFWNTKFSGRVLFAPSNTKRGPSAVQIFSKKEEDSGQKSSRSIRVEAVEVDFREVVLEPLDALTFRDADLRRCLFQDTDIRKAEITGASWPKIGGRYSVYDEIVRLEKGETRHWSRIERLYRELKQNYEDRHDYERAGDFHYGEKEMRRKNPEAPRHLRFFLTLYWLFSGYGEKYLRPLVWAGILLMMCTIGYLWLGLSPSKEDGCSKLAFENSKDWFQSFLYSVRIMTLLKPDDLVPSSGPSRAVQTFQSLFGPLFLGLFALAIRQRLRR